MFAFAATEMSAMFFERSIHEALWGFESWEISAHASDPSVIAVGEAQGRTLRDFCPAFPLLFKVIDAKSRLSVQVHPNEETRKLTGGDPKTEMWCALSDGPIYAGLREGTTAEDIAEAVGTGRFEELMVRHEAHFGDVFFIPGGLVHAIGDGVRLYEVQQSSDTTFRLYDWNRAGADGKPRELHVEKALQAIDYALPVPQACTSLTTPFFDFTQQTVRGEQELSADRKGFLAVYTARGEAKVGVRTLPEGTSMLLPPGVSCRVAAEDAHLMMTRFAATVH